MCYGRDHKNLNRLDIFKRDTFDEYLYLRLEILISISATFSRAEKKEKTKHNYPADQVIFTFSVLYLTLYNIFSFHKLMTTVVERMLVPGIS